MTVISTAKALSDTIADKTNNDLVTRTRAAQALVELKRSAKKSFKALGLSNTDEVMINELLEGSETPEFTGKMPAGVHKLSNMPKGNNVKGKIWEKVDVILPDGTGPVDGRVETKRGTFVYFYVSGQGYRAVRDRFNFTGGKIFALNDPIKK